MTVNVVVGHPYRVLTEAARASQLIVVSARGRGGFADLHLGSVARHLLSHCTSSVAVVRSRP